MRLINEIINRWILFLIFKRDDNFSFQNNEYMQSIARCLQMMLRIDQYRMAFIAADGVSTVLNVLTGKVNFQIQYQLIFCIWVLTFNPRIAERMNK